MITIRIIIGHVMAGRRKKRKREKRKKRRPLTLVAL
jgi:hypothetical protein